MPALTGVGALLTESSDYYLLEDGSLPPLMLNEPLEGDDFLSGYFPINGGYPHVAIYVDDVKVADVLVNTNAEQFDIVYPDNVTRTSWPWYLDLSTLDQPLSLARRQRIRTRQFIDVKEEVAGLSISSVLGMTETGVKAAELSISSVLGETETGVEELSVSSVLEKDEELISMYTPDGTFWVNTCVGGSKFLAKGMWHIGSDGVLIGSTVTMTPTENSYVNRIGRVQGSSVVTFADENGYLYAADGSALGAGGTPEPVNTDFFYTQDMVETDNPYYCGGTPLWHNHKIGTNTGVIGTTTGFGFYEASSGNCLLRRGLGGSVGLLCGVESLLDYTSGSGGIGGTPPSGRIYVQIRDASTFALLHSRHATEIEDFITASTDPYKNVDQFIINDFHVSAS